MKPFVLTHGSDHRASPTVVRTAVDTKASFIPVTVARF